MYILSLFRQSPNLRLTLSRKWLILALGFIDSALFGGTIFGWPQLVYVLKSEGVYRNLCSHSSPLHNDTRIEIAHFNFTHNNNQIEDLPSNNSRCLQSAHISYIGEKRSAPSQVLSSCPEQDDRFSLIFTISVLCYGVPGILIGYLVHYAGIRFTKLMAGSMISVSFIFLAITSEESPNWLFLSMILMGISSNAIRIGVSQLGDLFPKYRSTSITILTGVYGASSALFLLFDIFCEIGVSRSLVCYAFATIAALSTLSSFLLPAHHIPSEPARDIKRMETSNGQLNLDFRGDDDLSHINDTEDKVNKLTEQQKVEEKIKPPLSLLETCLSLASWLHVFWFFVALFSVNNYQQVYNVWITAISGSQDEVRRYSSYLAYANLLSVLVSALGGFFTDFMIKRARRNCSDEVSFRIKEIQAIFFPLLVTTIMLFVMCGSLLLFHALAIYVSLFAFLIVRSCIMSFSMAYTRLRFPEVHFSRLVGIYGTTSSALLFLQYPHFVWAQHQYYQAHLVALLFIVLSLSNPLHLLITPLIRNDIIKREI